MGGAPFSSLVCAASFEELPPSYQTRHRRYQHPLCLLPPHPPHPPRRPPPHPPHRRHQMNHRLTPPLMTPHRRAPTHTQFEAMPHATQ